MSIEIVKEAALVKNCTFDLLNFDNMNLLHDTVGKFFGYSIDDDKSIAPYGKSHQVEAASSRNIRSLLPNKSWWPVVEKKNWMLASRFPWDKSTFSSLPVNNMIQSLAHLRFLSRIKVNRYHTEFWIISPFVAQWQLLVKIESVAIDPGYTLVFPTEER